jgi:hypothetical protein
MDKRQIAAVGVEDLLTVYRENFTRNFSNSSGGMNHEKTN